MCKFPTISLSLFCPSFLPTQSISYNSSLHIISLSLFCSSFLLNPIHLIQFFIAHNVLVFILLQFSPQPNPSLTFFVTHDHFSLCLPTSLMSSIRFVPTSSSITYNFLSQSNLHPPLFHHSTPHTFVISQSYQSYFIQYNNYFLPLCSTILYRFLFQTNSPLLCHSTIHALSSLSIFVKSSTLNATILIPAIVFFHFEPLHPVFFQPNPSQLFNSIQDQFLLFLCLVPVLPPTQCVTTLFSPTLSTSPTFLSSCIPINVSLPSVVAFLFQQLYWKRHYTDKS